MPRAETINCFDVWQHLSAGSHTGSCSSPPPPPPGSSGWRRLPAKPQTAERLPFEVAPAQIRLQGAPLHLHQKPIIHLVNLKPVLVGHLRHSFLISVFFPGTQEHFQSLKRSVICSMLFLSLIRHLSFWSWRKHKPRFQSIRASHRKTSCSQITAYASASSYPTIPTSCSAPNQPTHTSSQILSCCIDQHLPPSPVYFNRM